jgi:hypothetical protein
MSEVPKQTLGDFLKSMPPELRQHINAMEHERAEKEHAEFRTAYQAGKCSICSDDLTSFKKNEPCLHWLLRPTGFTKWHFPSVAENFGCFQLQAFLRWVANEEAFARNINDLAVEGTGKMIELTIRYKTYEWAFSATESDFKGHKSNSSASQQPHYHFQMRVNKQAFIRYNDFHVPFHANEIDIIEAKLAHPDLIKHNFTGGTGMNDLLNDEQLEKIISVASSSGKEDEAFFKLDSFVEADEGATISGDDLTDLIEEAKQTGVTIASLLPRLKNAKVQTIVTPGAGVVEQAHRSGRGNKK